MLGVRQSFFEHRDETGWGGHVKSFNEITRWLHILVATLVVWSENRVQTVFQKLGAPHLYLLGILVLALIGMQLSDWLTLGAIEHTRSIRRLLAGGNDIEGDWVNVVVNTADSHRILYSEYCRVRYTRGSYVLSGDTWSLDGKWVGSFHSNGSNYQGRELEYYYRTGISRVGGFGLIIYSPDDSVPSDFICRYIDEHLGAPHVARGQRLSNKLNKVSMDERKNAALEFARDFDKSGLLDLDAMFGNKPTP
jgi:hypothetical protein